MTSAVAELAPDIASSDNIDPNDSTDANCENKWQEQEAPDNNSKRLNEKHDQFSNALAAIKEYATFAQVLRMGGAVGVVAAMSLFLLQGFDVANDLQRYLTLLAQTMTLTVAGFLVSYLLKDNKGARVFFGLGLISIPVNFAVLGAMLYSLISLDTQSVIYPAIVGWNVAGFGQLGIAALAGAAVLIPVTFFGFAIMAGPHAKRLGCLSLVSSLALLIPVRETAWVAVIAIAIIAFTITMLRRQSGDTSRLKTLEGRFAQTLIFVAPLLMVVRSVVLYSADIYAALVLATTVYMISRYSVNRLNANTTLSNAAYFIAVPAGFTVASLIAVIGANNFGGLFLVPLFSTIFSGLMLELNRTVVTPQISKQLVFVSAAIVLFYAHASISLSQGHYSIAIAGLVTFAIAVYALLQQRTVLALISGALLIPHAIIQFGDLWAMVDFGNWMTLAALGITAIIGASLLERYGATLMASWKKRGADRDARAAAAKELEREQAVVMDAEVPAAVATE